MRHAILLSALGLLLAACASDPMLPVREAYATGDYESAEQQLIALQKSEASDAHVFGLELGIVRQALGDPKAAVAALRKSRDTMDELAEGSYTDWAASVFLDDRSRTYPGADYEHVLVRAMLALADLMDGGHDAFAYGLQVLEKQLQIIETFEAKDGKNPKQAYKLVAFGNYIRAIINEADARGRSVARREFTKVLELAPDFAHGAADLERVTNGRFAAPGHGVVHVLALVGRGPERVELRHKPSRNAIAIGQAIWAIKHNQPFVPNIVPLPIPGLSFHQDNPDGVLVSVGGQRRGQTAMLTDVEAAAKTEFDAMRPYVMGRALVRRLLKVAVVEGGKRAVAHNREDKTREDHMGTDAIQIGLDILGNLWAATEGADLRCWSLLPASIQVLRLELPEGVHDLAIRPLRGGQPTGEERSVRLQVVAGYNTYVSALVPTRAGGPPPMTSRPAIENQ